MALIFCSNCGNKISDKALKCPKCGFAFETSVEKQQESLEKPESLQDQNSQMEDPDINNVSVGQTIQIREDENSERKDIDEPINFSSTTPNTYSDNGVENNSNNNNSKCSKVQIKGLWYIEFLLFILVVGVVYLGISQYRQTHSSDGLDSSNRVLVVEINNDLSESEKSDNKQINEALANGGMIRISTNNINSTLKSKIERYGATNSGGSYWVLGALLNYIASEGWTFVQGPSSGLSQNYYFIK